MRWPAPGFHPNISPEDYFGLKEIDGVLVRSNSMLHQFDRDPALFHAGYEKTVTNSMRKGSIFDCLVTQQHRFAEEYVIRPENYVSKIEGDVKLTTEFPGEWNGRTKPCREWKAEQEGSGFVVMTPEDHEEAMKPKVWNSNSTTCQKWVSDQTKTICTLEEFRAAEHAFHVLNADPRWQAITAGKCAYQVGVRADIDGRPFKGLIDILPDKEGEFGDAIVDLKRSAVVDTMADVLRHCRKALYNEQLGLYRGLTRLCGAKQRKRAILVIVPMTAPITPCFLELGEQMLSNGANAIMRIDARLRECEATGIWPGRFDGIKQIEQADETWAWTEVQEDLDEVGTLTIANA